MGRSRLVVRLRWAIEPLHGFESILIDRVEADWAPNPLPVLASAKVVQNARIAKYLWTVSDVTLPLRTGNGDW
jgi:hypothetical protein